MEVFNLTLSQMLMMFTLILVGYILRRKKVVPADTGTALAKLENYVFVPALSLYTQMTQCNVQTFKENYVLMLYGLVIVVSAILLSYPLSKLFEPKVGGSPEKQYRRNIYKYAMTFGNYGFMGNFIVLGIWGEALFYKYSLFTFFVGILCTSWGIYILIPKDKSAGAWKNLLKGLLSPPMIALALGMFFGLTGLSKYVPDFLLRTFNNASKCQGPVAMVLAGIVIGGYDLKGLLGEKKVYVASFLRLIVIPAVLMLVLKLLGTSDEIMTLALIAFATPLGLNTIVYPAAYGGETKTGASMTVISHTLSVITIPLMYLLFIVLL